MGVSVRNAASGSVTINLNTASASELDAVAQLKGHGFEIVRYRDERGRFESLRQLDEVPGLAGKTDGVEASVRVE
jgi:competence protein ComEA